MDPNAVNPYEQNTSAMPPQPVGQVPAYPNTSQLYDPLADARPKPDWQQAIYNSLAQQQAPAYPPIAYGTVPPPSPQVSIPPPAPTPQQVYSQPPPSPQAAYAAVADSANAPLGDVVLTDPYAVQSGGSAKKVLLIIAIVIVAAVLVGGVALVMYRYGYGKGVLSAQSSSVSADESSGDDTDNQEMPDTTVPSLSFELQSPQYIDEFLSGGIGDQLVAADGLVLMVHNVTRNYQPDGGSIPTSRGEIIKVDILVGNADSTAPKQVESTMFQLIDMEGNTVAPLGDTVDAPLFLSLNPGMRAQMSLLYEISGDLEYYSLARSQGYRVNGIVYTVALDVVLVGGSGGQELGSTSL